MGNQFQQPPQNQAPFQPMQFRPIPPFRQQGPGLQNHFGQSQFQPISPNGSPPLVNNNKVLTQVNLINICLYY